MIQFNFAMWLNELVELPQVDSDKSCQSVCPTATVVWLIELIDNWRNLALKDQEGIENYLENVSGREFIEGLQKSISDDFIFHSERLEKNVKIIPQEEECRGISSSGVKPLSGFVIIRPRKKIETVEHGKYVGLHEAVKIPAEAIKKIKAVGGCALSCLHLSGGQVSSKTVGAYKKTHLYKNDSEQFYNSTLEQYLKAALRTAYEKCVEKDPEKNYNHYAVRLNGTSDITHHSNTFNLRPETLKSINSYAVKKFGIRPAVIKKFENVKFFDVFNDIWNQLIKQTKCELKLNFYDYTAIPSTMKKYHNKELPGNYHVTFSVKEGNIKEVLEALDHGMGVALPIWIGGVKKVEKIPFPEFWYPNGLGNKRYRIVDGDLSDARFLDKSVHGIKSKEGYVVGLRAKGKLEDVTDYDTGFAERMLIQSSPDNSSPEALKKFYNDYPKIQIDSLWFFKALTDFMKMTGTHLNPRFDPKDPAVKEIILEQILYTLRRNNLPINSLGPLKSKDYFDVETQRSIKKLVNLSDLNYHDMHDVRPGISAKTEKGRVPDKMTGTSAKVEKGQDTINVKTNQLNMLPHQTYAAIRNTLEDIKNKKQKLAQISNFGEWYKLRKQCGKIDYAI